MKSPRGGNVRGEKYRSPPSYLEILHLEPTLYLIILQATNQPSFIKYGTHLIAYQRERGHMNLQIFKFQVINPILFCQYKSNKFHEDLYENEDFKHFNMKTG